MSASNPIREQLRNQRKEISILIELIGNGEQVASAAQVLAIKTVIDAIKTEIDAATNASITTI